MKTTLLTLIVVMTLGSAAVGQVTTGSDESAESAEQAEPRRLTAYAYVTVLPPAGASKTTKAFIANAAGQALPTERFASVTVGTEDDLAAARAAAVVAEADVFLHLTLAGPTVGQFTETVRWGRVGRTVTVYVARTPMVLELRVRNGANWLTPRIVRFTSAEVPGAEQDEYRRPGDNAASTWGRAVRLMVPVACERVLQLQFLPNTTLRAIESDPDDVDAPAPADAPDAPQALLKTELTNRSHCRIADATVTIEQYNKARRRWEAIDTPRGLGGWLRRQDPRRRNDTTLVWPISGEVDPGHKAFSEIRPINEGIFQAVKRATCRLVLHATPLVRTLTPPRTPHPMEKP